MKRISCISLSTIIILLIFCLTSCTDVTNKEKDALSFESSQEMFDSIKGVWSFENKGYKKFLVFKGEEMYVFDTEDFKHALSEIYTKKISKNESVSDVKFESIINNLEEIIFKSPYVQFPSEYENEDCYECDIEYEKGEILFDFDEKIVITHNGIKCAKENSDLNCEDEYSLFKKVENIPSLNSKTFQVLFNNIKDKHVIESYPFFPKTGTQYAEILKENYPGLKNWTLYNEGDGEQSTIYFKNGDTNSGLLDYNDSQCIFLWGSNKKDFAIYKAGDKTLIIQSNSSFGEELYKYADWLLSNFPYKLSGSELFEMFENEGTVSGGVKSFDKVIDHIEYKIDKSVTAGSGVIQIICK